MSKYISGGYYLTRLSELPSYVGILSASRCICKFFPDSWAIEWASASAAERTEDAAAFGISSSKLPIVVAWATEKFARSFGWPNSFYTLEAAQKTKMSFFSEDPDIVVFGLGLHESSVDVYLSAAKPPSDLPGYAPNGETGVFQCVKAGNEVAQEGNALGFELLGTHLGLIACSWLCGGLEKDCATHLGVHLTQRGLVESYSDAVRCGEFISRPDTRAEPGLWLPWLVTKYSV